ncbi:MAG TPA: PadR family transcriptional regulator [Candidatus Faecousia intestinigallinarum]|nr:PadR family transcriptional regulator [Candidatus Faecousia intestinigallinarum]
MNTEEIVAGWMLELRRGILTLIALAQLRKPAYGYHLVKKLNDNAIPIDANTLYPLLRRLEGQGLLKSQWNTTEAKPRKYYEITPEGLSVLEKAKDEYRAFSQHVDALLEEPL